MLLRNKIVMGWLAGTLLLSAGNEYISSKNELFKVLTQEEKTVVNNTFNIKDNKLRLCPHKRLVSF